MLLLPTVFPLYPLSINVPFKVLLLQLLYHTDSITFGMEISAYFIGVGNIQMDARRKRRLRRCTVGLYFMKNVRDFSSKNRNNGLKNRRKKNNDNNRGELCEKRVLLGTYFRE